MRHVSSWRDDAGAFPPGERPKPVIRDHTDTIRFHHSRGMSVKSLVNIYGSSAVSHALGGAI